RCFTCSCRWLCFLGHSALLLFFRHPAFSEAGLLMCRALGEDVDQSVATLCNDRLTRYPVSGITVKYSVIGHPAGRALACVAVACLLAERFGADISLSQLNSCAGQHFTQPWQRRFDGFSNFRVVRNEMCAGTVLIQVQRYLYRPHFRRVKSELGDLFVVGGEPYDFLAEITGPGAIMDRCFQFERS